MLLSSCPCQQEGRRVAAPAGYPVQTLTRCAKICHDRTGITTPSMAKMPSCDCEAQAPDLRSAAHSMSCSRMIVESSCLLFAKKLNENMQTYLETIFCLAWYQPLTG